MDIIYHIREETGEPGQCHASSSEKCPYFDKETNTPAPHFDNKTDARAFIEEKMVNEYGKNSKSLSKNNIDKNYNGVKYDKDNITPEVEEYIKTNRGSVQNEEVIDGLTFTTYDKPLYSMEDYISLVNVKGNVKNVDFTKDPELYKKLGFKGYDAFQDNDIKIQDNICELSLKNITDNEKEAINWFTDSYYQDFNRVIYRRTDVEKADLKRINEYPEIMENLDSALSKAPKINKVVYRAMGAEASIFNKENIEGNSLKERINNYVDQNYQVGKTVNFKGYQSTTSAGFVASGWSGGGVLFEIMTPEGLPIKDISSDDEEQEVLLPRDSNYVIIGVQKPSPSDMWGKSVVQMVAVNNNGDILDGTNADQKNTWDELMEQPLKNSIYN